MIFDIIIGLVALYLIYDGFKKGIIIKMFEMTGTIIAIYLTIKTQHIVGSYLQKFNYEFLRYKISIFIITFLLIYISLCILIKIIGKFSIGSGTVNSILGIAVSLIECYMILYVVLIASLYAKDYIDGVENQLYSSYAMNFISKTGKNLNKYLPDNIEKKLDEFYFENKKEKFKKDIFNLIDNKE